MKKTLITTLVTIGLAASASAATLQYGLDFNNIDSYGVVFENLGDGTTAINSSTGYRNYGTEAPLTDGGHTHRNNGATFNIADDSGINGLNLTDGFSLAVHLNYGDSNNWKDALTLKLDDTTFRIEMNAGNSWVVYGGEDLGFDNGHVLASNIDHNTWYPLGLTFQGDKMQVFLDGELQKTLTLTTGQDSLVQQIRGSGTNNGWVYMDNLAVYDSVLDEEFFTYLSTSNIPEPTTATLSLLALAGLAARRRRK